MRVSDRDNYEVTCFEGLQVLRSNHKLQLNYHLEKRSEVVERPEPADDFNNKKIHHGCHKRSSFIRSRRIKLSLNLNANLVTETKNGRSRYF
jgi:hypothetical protein